MAGQNNTGEEKAWNELATLEPLEVCKAAEVLFDQAKGSYLVRSLGKDFSVFVQDRRIVSVAPGSEVLLQRLGYFFRLSVLWYLTSAKEIACTGRLVRLPDIKGGDIFTKGSHVLPLEPLARKFGRDKEGFLATGKGFGGTVIGQADAALRLDPLPRVPVVLSLWLEDDEFPARADLLFDSTCSVQLPTDIVWSVAMMTVLAML